MEGRKIKSDALPFHTSGTGRFELVHHMCPVHGHSFLPNDRDFGGTELAKRRHGMCTIPTSGVTLSKEPGFTDPSLPLIAASRCFLTTTTILHHHSKKS